MRTFWSIERAVLEAAARDYQASADGLHAQMTAAQVTHFENTGAGFFSTVKVSPDAPLLPDKSLLNAGTGGVGSLEHQMGFLIFIEDGFVTLIEGYTNGDDSTVGVDFETVTFDIKPWSLAGD
jgi:hypothetical protein